MKHLELLIYSFTSAGNSMGGLNKVPQFMFNDDPTGQLADDGSLDQTVPNLGSPVNTSPGSERVERFSRKVFVGGLPPDIDEGGYSYKNKIYHEIQKIPVFLMLKILTPGFNFINKHLYQSSPTSLPQ